MPNTSYVQHINFLYTVCYLLPLPAKGIFMFRFEVMRLEDHICSDITVSVAAPQFCIRKHWTCQASGKIGFEAAFYITPDDLSEHERRSSAIIHGIMLKPPCVLLRLLSRHLGFELGFPASQ